LRTYILAAQLACTPTTILLEVALHKRVFVSQTLQLVVCESSPVGRLALTVCYDLRFPEMWQRLAFDMVRGSLDSHEAASQQSLDCDQGNVLWLKCD